MINTNFASFIESVDFSIKRIQKLKTKFEQLKLISKEKKDKLRTQISAAFAALTKKQKEIEQTRRKSKFSFDSADLKNLFTFEIINDSILQQINRALDIQNANINAVVERINSMKIALIKLIAIIQRIEVKLN